MHIFIKMRKALSREIEIPDGVQAELERSTLIIKGAEGENRKNFKIGKLIFKKEGQKIILECKNATKKEKRLMNAVAKHIKNMVLGVQKKFVYTLKICSSHFPITVEIKGNEASIKNFLGEKIPRKVKIPENVDARIERDTITIKSFDKELAGQSAANFEVATRISSRDRRVFQDGIFIISKDKRKI